MHTRSRTETHLTVREAAERLGYSETWLRTLLGFGRVQGAYKHGRDWVLPVPVLVLGADRETLRQWPG